MPHFFIMTVCCHVFAGGKKAPSLPVIIGIAVGVGAAVLLAAVAVFVYW